MDYEIKGYKVIRVFSGTLGKRRLPIVKSGTEEEARELALSFLKSAPAGSTVKVIQERYMIFD